MRTQEQSHARPQGCPDLTHEVTPEMIEADVYAAREHPLGAPLADLVEAVYLAMVLEGGSTKPSASRINSDK